MPAFPLRHSFGRQLLEWIVLGVFLYGLVSLFFYCFPLVFRMASNADSLVMLDFARDILIGQSIAHWNLPRAPYLFPDALIAWLMMAIGWSNVYTFKVIAVINLGILVWICTIVLRSAKGLQAISYLQVGLLGGLALVNIAIFFPVAMANLYWQIFASGAHFLMALVVLGIFQLSARWRSAGYSPAILSLLFFLSFAQAVSDSLCAPLLLTWIVAQLIWRFPQRCRPFADVLAVFMGLVLGTLASFFIPRQSLLNSFFSFDKFIAAALSCWEWFISSPENYGFIVVLIVLVLVYPFLLAGEWPKTKADLFAWLQSDALLPSLSVVVTTPIFFQEVGSIRYLAFPGLISLLCLSLLYLRVWQLFSRSQTYRKVMYLLVFIALLSAMLVWQLGRERIGPHMKDHGGKDMIGLAVGSQTELAVACLDQAKARLNLQDGVATYWNARPTRFASNFDYFFAQINPWRPRSGYMMWGNNGIDFIYRDSEKKTPRQYNFLLATKHELGTRLWGSLPAQASNTIECPMHSIFYFDNPDILWDYLFPLEVPFGFTAANPTNAGTITAGMPRSASERPSRTFPADDFFTLVGSREGAALKPTGQAGILAYGPYIPLLAGQYRLIAQGTLTSALPANALIDVSAQYGKQLIAAKNIALTNAANHSESHRSASGNPPLEEIARIDFEIKHTTQDLEFRLQVPANTQGQFLGFVLQRLSKDQAKIN